MQRDLLIEIIGKFLFVPHAVPHARFAGLSGAGQAIRLAFERQM
jgi:hypothetical protein